MGFATSKNYELLSDEELCLTGIALLKNMQINNKDGVTENALALLTEAFNNYSAATIEAISGNKRKVATKEHYKLVLLLKLKQLGSQAIMNYNADASTAIITNFLNKKRRLKTPNDRRAKRMLLYPLSC